jgi:WD40 repeat protein
LLGKPFRAHQSEIRSLAFTPDGKALASASGDTAVKFWSVAKRTPFGEALQGRAPFSAVRVSPDGRLAVAGTETGAIVLFDVTGRQPLGEPLVGHTGNVFSVAFAANGTLVVSAGRDGRVLLWDVRPWADELALRDRACSLVGRNLTRSEWSQYLPGKSYRRTCDQWPAGR